MGFPTPEQTLAINAEGNILVSAAAGSGKTAVLVERVIKKLCDKNNGIGADKLLIVTFTNAAAAEMRGRIEKRLDEEIFANPDDTALLKQKHLLGGAKICTIDSFCIDLVRENFEKLGIAPDFKISDAGLLRPTDEAVMLGIINRYLEEKNEIFDELLDIIGAEYDENNFIDFALEIYNYSRQLPFPEKWFKTLSDDYNNGVFDKENRWYKYAVARGERLIADAVNSIAEAVDLLFVSEKAADGYLPAFRQTAEGLERISEAFKSGEWDNIYNALNEFTAARLPSVRGVTDIYEVGAAKDIYAYINDKVISKLKNLFYGDFSFVNSQFEKLYKPLCLLSDILIEFDNSLFEEYKKLNTFTFHNTEHMALRLLCEKSDDGNVLPKADAKEIISRFEEVMVDECQDTNDLQDMLFKILSNNERNLFTVGDIKQSIYRFRGANPKNFLNKKNKCVPIEKAEGDLAKKIILGNNFRCKREVCNFINFVFSLFMTEKTGDIVYNDEEKLIAGAIYPETKGAPCEIHLINTKGSNLKNIEIEARDIADYIKSVLSEGAVLRKDDNTLRAADYSDFTILLRSAKLKAPLMAAELKKQGIPVTYNLENFADSMEISVILSLLTVIDNPRSDVELLSVMTSPIFGFGMESLANIRADHREGSLYNAVISAAENGDENAAAFLKRLEKYRLYAAVNPLPKLIRILLDDTDYLQSVTAMEDGIRRRNNLILLIDYANRFYENGNSSPGAFVRFIEKQSENGLKAAGNRDTGNAVNIMSIHASKGLQFPICIIAESAAEFNNSDSRKNTLYSTDFGIGFKYYDETDKKRYTTISREALLDKIRIENLREEERLLYVAMTRTQDRLLITGSYSDVYKKCSELKAALISYNSEIDYGLFTRTKSYAEWLILSLLLHPCGKELRGNGSAVAVRDDDSFIKVVVKDHDSLGNAASKTQSDAPAPDMRLSASVSRNIAFKYPYGDILGVESKASVSMLANSAEADKYAFSYKPGFMNEGGITPTQRGTAMHKVMEFYNFEKSQDIDFELERLYEWQFISENEYNSIDKARLQRFFNSDIFKRIKKSALVKREMRFLTEVPVKRIAPDVSEESADENIIIQGAVDICFVEEDGVVILDFKTDRVQSAEELASAYAEQLNIYAAACEKIFAKPVKQKLIYSFALSKEIEV